MKKNEIIDFVLRFAEQAVFYVAMTPRFEHGYRYVGISNVSYGEAIGLIVKETPMLVQIDSDIPRMNRKELNIWLDELELWERKNKQTYRFLYGRGVDRSISTM